MFHGWVDAAGGRGPGFEIAGGPRRGDGPASAAWDKIDTGWEMGPGRNPRSVMILPQVHLRKPCYDFYFL